MGLIYRVSLEETEQQSLQALIQKGKASARKIRRAHTLLLAASGETDATIAQVLQVGLSTVERTRKRFVEEGLEAALNERPRSGGPRKLDASGEALIIATACTTPPAGYRRWTVRLLADRAVELGVSESVSRETVRQLLKKTISSPGASGAGVLGS
jgi:transposase